MISKKFTIVGLAITHLMRKLFNVWQVGKSIFRIMRLYNGTKTILIFPKWSL